MGTVARRFPAFGQTTIGAWNAFIRKAQSAPAK